MNGTRENGNVANEALAKNGVIVAALDFRVPPEASYPASLADIHYGVRWCKANAEGWNGISEKIGAMGTSSGAHQAMLLGHEALRLPLRRAVTHQRRVRCGWRPGLRDNGLAGDRSPGSVSLRAGSSGGRQASLRQ